MSFLTGLIKWLTGEKKLIIKDIYGSKVMHLDDIISRKLLPKSWGFQGGVPTCLDGHPLYIYNLSSLWFIVKQISVQFHQREDLGYSALSWMVHLPSQNPCPSTVSVHNSSSCDSGDHIPLTPWLLSLLHCQVLTFSKPWMYFHIPTNHS